MPRKIKANRQRKENSARSTKGKTKAHGSDATTVDCKQRDNGTPGKRTNDKNASSTHGLSNSTEMKKQDNSKKKSGQTLSDVAGAVVGIVGGTLAGAVVWPVGSALGGPLAGTAFSAGTAGFSGVAIHEMMSKNVIFMKLILICVCVVTLAILQFYFFNIRTAEKFEPVEEGPFSLL